MRLCTALVGGSISIVCFASACCSSLLRPWSAPVACLASPPFGFSLEVSPFALPPFSPTGSWAIVFDMGATFPLSERNQFQSAA